MWNWEKEITFEHQDPVLKAQAILIKKSAPLSESDKIKLKKFYQMYC